MQKTKMSFEMVPVEMVRGIATVDGPMDEECNDEKPERMWDGRSRRPWQELARAISEESDPIKIGELCKQLDAALSEEERRRGRGIPGFRGADGNKHIAS